MSRKQNDRFAEDAFLRLPQVSAMTGLSRATIYRQMADHGFPRGVRVSKRVTVWLESEIRDWMHAQIRRCRAAG